MNRRLMFGGGSGAGVIPDPPDGGGGNPDPTWPGWPLTDDADTLSSRPAGRLLDTYVVGGSSPTHATIGDASTDAQGAALADGRSGGAITWLGNPGPDYRVDVLVSPGVYLEHLGWGGWINLVGTGDAPADTVIRDAANSQGAIHTFGSMHMENLTVEAGKDGGGAAPKYALHITGAEQVTAVDVTFDVTDGADSSNWGDIGVMGADFLTGSVAVFYRCTFRGQSGQEGNMHGPTGGTVDTPDPITTVYVDCTWEGGLRGPQFGGAAPQTGEHAMYVIGCTGITEVLAESSTRVYTDDPDVPVTGGVVTRGITSWPAPVEGLSEQWADYYLPSAIGESALHTPAVSDAGPMTPTANRTYITRIKPDAAARATHARHTATAGGTYGAVINPADGDEPTLLQPGLDYPNLAGVNEYLHYYFTTRYPGNNGWWVYHRFSSGSSVTGSAQLAGVTDCFYTDDGTTLVPVSAGTPHPLPTLRTT